MVFESCNFKKLNFSDPAPIEAHNLSSGYITENPSWDVEDCYLKAGKVPELLEANFIVPKSMVDVGCVAGSVLLQMRDVYPNASLTVYDNAPDAEHFGITPRAAGIDRVIGNFLDSSVPIQVAQLLLDVVDQLKAPFSFLSKLKGRAKHYVSHFPLYLSAVSVTRESPLLCVRDKVGHVHYYKRGLALSFRKNCGYGVVEARFAGAAFNILLREWNTILAQIPRRPSFTANRNWGDRFFGGETLIVLAVDTEAK